MVTEGYTGQGGRTVELDDTIAGCAAILEGEADGWAESSLYMVGTLDEAREREQGAAASDASTKKAAAAPAAATARPEEASK